MINTHFSWWLLRRQKKTVTPIDKTTIEITVAVAATTDFPDTAMKGEKSKNEIPLTCARERDRERERERERERGKREKGFKQNGLWVTPFFNTHVRTHAFLKFRQSRGITCARWVKIVRSLAVGGQIKNITSPAATVTDVVATPETLNNVKRKEGRGERKKERTHEKQK